MSLGQGMRQFYSHLGERGVSPFQNSCCYLLALSTQRHQNVVVLRACQDCQRCKDWRWFEEVLVRQHSNYSSASGALGFQEKACETKTLAMLKTGVVPTAAHYLIVWLKQLRLTCRTCADSFIQQLMRGLASTTLLRCKVSSRFGSTSGIPLVSMCNAQLAHCLTLSFNG